MLATRTRVSLAAYYKSVGLTAHTIAYRAELPSCLLEPSIPLFIHIHQVRSALTIGGNGSWVIFGVRKNFFTMGKSNYRGLPIHVAEYNLQRIEIFVHALLTSFGVVETG